MGAPTEGRLLGHDPYQEAIAVEGIHHHTIYRAQTADYGGR